MRNKETSENEAAICEYVELAYENINKENYNHALFFLNWALAIEPNSPSAIGAKTELFDIMPLDRAIDLLSKILKESPNDYWLLYLMGIILLHLGYEKIGSKLLDAAVRIHHKVNEGIRD